MEKRSGLVQHKKPNGTVYVYKIVDNFWDPEKQQSRNKQVCIGKLDPETGELIPSKRLNESQAASLDAAVTAKTSVSSEQDRRRDRAVEGAREVVPRLVAADRLARVVCRGHGKRTLSRGVVVREPRDAVRGIVKQSADQRAAGEDVGGRAADVLQAVGKTGLRERLSLLRHHVGLLLLGIERVRPLGVQPRR